MSVDPNEYDVGELRAIAGVDDAGDAAESEPGPSDAVDATPDAGQATSEGSDAADTAPEGVGADTGTDQGDTDESGPWEAVPTVEERESEQDDDEDDDPWLSVPDADDDGDASGDDPGDTDTPEGTTPAEEGIGAHPAADDGGESGADPEGENSNPFTVDVEPSGAGEPEETAPTEAETSDAKDATTPQSERETGTDDGGAGDETASAEPAPQSEAGVPEEADAHVTADADEEVEDPLAALIEDEDGSVPGESGEAADPETPDSPAAPDRIEGPRGEPGVDTRTEIAEALNATTRGGTRRITRDASTAPVDGPASPEDTLLDGVPADEQVTVEGADLPDEESSTERGGWTVETSTEAVEALYSGPGDDTETTLGDDDGRAFEDDTDAAPEEGDLSGADAIDFGFDGEDEEDDKGPRLSEQVADVLYAGEDTPE